MFCRYKISIHHSISGAFHVQKVQRYTSGHCQGALTMAKPSRTVLIAHLDVDKSHLDRYRQLIKTHAENSLRIEPGCLRFEILAPQESPTQLILFEVYTDDTALESHSNSKHMAEYRKRTKGMVLKSTIYRCTAEYL